VTLPDSSLETHDWADPAGEFGEHLCVGREEIHVVTAAEFSIREIAAKPGHCKPSNLAAGEGSQRDSQLLRSQAKSIFSSSSVDSCSAAGCVPVIMIRQSPRSALMAAQVSPVEAPQATAA
jgi:hypothetical protein